MSPELKPMPGSRALTVMGMFLVIVGLIWTMGEYFNRYFHPSSTQAGSSQPSVPSSKQSSEAQMIDEECTVRKSILNVEMRQRIRDDLKDYPLLIAVACRESGFNQMNPASPNEVLLNRNKDGTVKIGVLQISSAHEELWKDLKEDPYTLKGNLAIAKVIYDREGIDPWFPHISRRQL